MITNDIKYIGVNDHEIDLFEGQYLVPNGMAYNSYLILDDKITVMDTVDGSFGEEWLAKMKAELNGRKPDYLIVQHMEPDHSANIEFFLKEFPEAAVVGNAKTFTMIDQFFSLPEATKKMVVKDGDVLSTGRHELNFVFAPMVHWPEVMVTYDSCDKVLFSADGFGKFGALDVEEDWDCEARRYYIGIVGKYGAQVQKLLKTAASLDIQAICPLHGPVLKENLGYYLKKYDMWSSYCPEEKGVLIAYASVYGNTKKAAEILAEKLRAKGCEKVVVCDLARDDMAECIEDAFRYDRLVLASVTYNAGIFPCMNAFIHGLVERNYQNRKVGIIENGSWAPVAGKVIRSMFEKSKNITFYENNVRLLSAVKPETEEKLDLLAEEICKGE